MSLTSALSISLTSLQTLNTQIRTVSDNVSNANNPNYNRQSVLLSNNALGGVQIDAVERDVNKGILSDLRSAISDSSYNSEVSSLFLRIEELLGTSNGTTPLSNLIEEFQTAWKAYENTPEIDAAAADVINRGIDIATEITRISDGIDSIQTDLQNEINDDVTTLNNALIRVEELNQQIVANTAQDLPIASLENQRDAEIATISQYADIRTFDRDQGKIAVYAKGGIDLVDSNASTFTYDPLTQTLSKSDYTGDATDIIGNGEIAAKLNVMKIDAEDVTSANPEVGMLQKLKNRLDELAYSFADDSTAVASGSVHLDNTADVTTLTNLAGPLAAGDQFQISANGGVPVTITVAGGTSATALVTAINAASPAAPNTFRARIDGHGQLEISTTEGTLQIIDGPTNAAATALGLTPATTAVRNPPTFANAYNGITALAGEAGNFFEAVSGATPLSVNRTNLRVNDTLTNGTETLKQNSGNAVVEALTSTSRSSRGSSSSISGVDYTGLAASILTDTAKFSDIFETRATSSETIQTNLNLSLRNEVGVDIDEEVAFLTVLQNSYGASARVIEVTNQLFAELQQIV